MGTFPNGSTRNYTICNGCPIIKAPVDIDTVDGHSYPGVAPAGVTDSATGEAIEEGAPVTVFFGPDGEIVGYKDCTELNDYSVLIDAPINSTDDAGNTYVIGDPLLITPEGDVICQKKTTDTDTFTTLIVAGSSGTDAAGNQYSAGETLQQLADGSLICAEKTIDTNDGFVVQGYSDGTALDQDGDPIPAGNPLLHFHDADGLLVNSKDCRGSHLITTAAAGTDDAGNDYDDGAQLIVLNDGSLVCAEKALDTNTFGVVMTADVAFTDTVGNDVAVDDQYQLYPNGDTACLEKTIDTVDGYALIGFSDGTQLDQNDNPIPSGNEIITTIDGDGNIVAHVDVQDDDTFGIATAAPAGAVDAWGNPIPTGANVIELANGSFVCIPESVLVDLCLPEDNENFAAVRRKQLIDPKTGQVRTFIEYSEFCAVRTEASSSSFQIDETIPVGLQNSVVISQTPPMPNWGCPTLRGQITLTMQMNADGNPPGAPGETLNFVYRINGGAWKNIQPLGSFSPSILGADGATGSTAANQEIIVDGTRENEDMPAGAILEFGVSATNDFDPGEGVALQAIKGTFNYVAERCKEITE